MSVGFYFCDFHSVEITGEERLDLWGAFARKVLAEIANKKWDGRILGLSRRLLAAAFGVTGRGDNPCGDSPTAHAQAQELDCTVNSDANPG
jgi:hypothetical protein